MAVRDVGDALALLERLGAPARLLRHHELVVEARDPHVADMGPMPYVMIFRGRKPRRERA